MRILFDECVPWPMHRLITGHSCASVQGLGWSGIRNGDLLKRAEAEFDLFITRTRTFNINKTWPVNALPFWSSRRMTFTGFRPPAPQLKNR
jgi:hypothetical protein